MLSICSGKSAKKGFHHRICVDFVARILWMFYYDQLYSYYICRIRFRYIAKFVSYYLRCHTITWYISVNKTSGSSWTKGKMNETEMICDFKRIKFTKFQFLLIISSLGAGLSLVALGTYTYLNSLGYYVQPFSWLAIASFSSMLFLASCGIIPLPYVILSEIMPDKVRQFVFIERIFFLYF